MNTDPRVAQARGWGVDGGEEREGEHKHTMGGLENTPQKAWRAPIELFIYLEKVHLVHQMEVSSAMHVGGTSLQENADNRGGKPTHIRHHKTRTWISVGIGDVKQYNG